MGQEADPHNFLLMHAMGPNVAGVIGTAVAAGIMLAIFGGGTIDGAQEHAQALINQGAQFVRSIFVG